jgi:hypothetical protein
MPIIVAALSLAWPVFAFSKAGAVSSNPTRDMDVYVPLNFVLCIGSGLKTGRSPV